MVGFIVAVIMVIILFVDLGNFGNILLNVNFENHPHLPFYLTFSLLFIVMGFGYIILIHKLIDEIKAIRKINDEIRQSIKRRTKSCVLGLEEKT